MTFNVSLYHLAAFPDIGQNVFSGRGGVTGVWSHDPFPMKNLVQGHFRPLSRSGAISVLAFYHTPRSIGKSRLDLCPG